MRNNEERMSGARVSAGNKSALHKERPKIEDERMLFRTKADKKKYKRIERRR